MAEPELSEAQKIAFIAAHHPNKGTREVYARLEEKPRETTVFPRVEVPAAPADDAPGVGETAGRSFLNGATGQGDAIIADAKTGGGPLSEGYAAMDPASEGLGGISTLEGNQERQGRQKAVEGRKADFEKEKAVQQERSAAAHDAHGLVSNVTGGIGYMGRLAAQSLLGMPPALGMAANAGFDTIANAPEPKVEPRKPTGSFAEDVKNDVKNLGQRVDQLPVGRAGANAALAFILGKAGQGLIKGPTSAGLALPALGIAGERAGRVIDEGRAGAALEKPEKAVEAGLASLLLALPFATRAGATAGRKALRSGDTETAQSLRDLDQVGETTLTGPEVNEDIKTQYGSRRPVQNAAFRAAEDALAQNYGDDLKFYKGNRAQQTELAQRGDEHAPLPDTIRSKMLDEVAQREAANRDDQGRAIPGEADTTLSNWRAFLSPMTVDTGVIGEDGKPVFREVNPTITRADLVKFRRQFDEAGKVGKAAGRSEKPFKELAAVARNTLADVDPAGYGKLFAEEHAGLTAQENRNRNLGLPAKPRIKPDPMLTERVAGRLASTRGDDVRAGAREAHVTRAANASPTLAETLPTIQGLQALEKLKLTGEPLGIGLFGGKMQPTGRFKIVRDLELPAAGRLDAALRLFEKPGIENPISGPDSAAYPGLDFATSRRLGLNRDIPADRIEPYPAAMAIHSLGGPHKKRQSEDKKDQQ